MLKKILKLIIVVGAIWFFFVIIGPSLSENIPAWKRYNAVQDEQGLDSGALYYSNVPQTQEAEEKTRKAVQEGMAKRRELKQEKSVK